MDSTTDGPEKSPLPIAEGAEGLSNALPGANVNVQLVAVRVGQPIGTPFPTTIRRLYPLTNVQLSTLAHRPRQPRAAQGRVPKRS
jgi:hypothetical protein